MRPGIETIRATFEDAKESGAGAITFACPECEAEGRPGEEFTVFANGITSCRRAARAGRDFAVPEDGAISWKVKGDLPELLEGEPCEGLRVEFLAEILNQDLPEKKKVFPQRYGITIRSLGFRTKELTKGAYRKKTAVVFCRNDFPRVFNSFSLALPADFVPASPAPEAKPNDSNEMRAPAQFENDSPEKKCAGARISLDTNGLSHGAGDAGTDF
jgi:hypothetical protein